MHLYEACEHPILPDSTALPRNSQALIIIYSNLNPIKSVYDCAQATEYVLLLLAIMTHN